MGIGRRKETDAEAVYVPPEALCVGLYVHLDLPWTEHPFTFSSFKIKSAEQVETLRGLGLARIRYSPDKSDCQPAVMPPDAGPAGDAEATQPPPSADDAAQAEAREAMLRAAQEQRKRLAVQRAKASICRHELVAAARTMRAITQDVFARPAEARDAAEQLVRHMAASMLVDADVSIHLMTDRIGNEEVYFHALNVSLLSMMLARQLKAPKALVHAVGMGALFHDIGELEIPERIVRQAEPLTRSELALLHMHADYGVNLARKLGLPAEVQQVIQQHHEKADGSGYPKALTAVHMSLPARIVSLVNAYDELCNPPNPAQAMTPHEALSTLFAQQRQQYDALVLGTFVHCMGVYPPGTIVGLSDDSIAMVVSVNTAKPLRPVVLIHDPAVRKEEALVVDLASVPALSIARTLRPHQLSPEAFAYLAPGKRMTCYFDTEPEQRLAA